MNPKKFLPRLPHTSYVVLSKRLVASCISLLVLILTPMVSYADWSAGIEGGTVFRDEGQATRFRLKAQNPDRPFSQFVYLDWLRISGGGNAYEIGYRPRYWLSPKFYVFGEGNIRVDSTIAIDNEALLQAGVGYAFVATPQTQLWLEAGAGTRNTEFEGGIEDTTDSFGIIRGAFSQVLADLIRFEVDVDAIQSETLLETSAEAGISIRIPAGSIKLSYRARRLDPDEGETIDDEDSFVSFSYGF